MEEEVEEEEAGEGDAAAQLMRNPAVLAALQGRLDGLGSPAGYIEVGWLTAPPVFRQGAWQRFGLDY